MDHAVSLVEGLLSPKGDKSESKAKPTAKQPTSEQSDDSESSESADEQASTEESEESANTTEEESSEEATEESPEDASDDTEASDETDETPTRSFKVKIAGKEVEVTENELLAGYSRDSDYRQKTMALAEEKKRFEAETIVPLRAARQKYEENLTKIESALKEAYPSEPNWQELREKLTPDEFAAELLGWQQREKNMAAVKAEQTRIDGEKQAEYAEQAKAYVAEQEDKLLTALPAWRKPEVAEKEQKELNAYGLKLGFTNDELKQVRDHRLVLLLRNAMLYDRGVQKKPTIQNKIKEALEATPPTGGRTKGVKSKGELAKARLAKSGSVDDAAEAVLAGMAAGRM